MSAGIEFVNVEKRYGSGPKSALAVKGISFSVPQGSLTTILGPSGCGKTTTLRMIAGLEQPTAGHIKIAGKDVTGLSPAQRNVSLVFQSYALFPHMKVIDNVAYGLVSGGMDKTQAAQKAEQTLATVGLTGLSSRYPSELSGGQQQRVAVARALVIEPAVLLFDEPLSNLDARLRRSMREEIRTLQQRLKLTVAYVTHDQSEALAVSDQIIVMDQGTISQIGTPAQLYAQPANAFVAGFMGEALLLSATAAEDGSVTLGPLTVRPAHTPSAGKVSVAVRPEAWLVHDAGAAPLAGQIIKSAYLGGFYEYTVSSQLGELFVVCPDVAHPRAAGADISLSLAPTGVAVVAA